MKDKVGVWIDHKKAVIVFASPHQATARTLESEVGAHPHFAGSQEGGGEKKYEERFKQALDRYYDAVIKQMGQPQNIFIFGPGEAKTELKERLGRPKALPGSIVAVRATRDGCHHADASMARSARCCPSSS